MIFRNALLAPLVAVLWLPLLTGCATPDPAKKMGLPTAEIKDCKPEDLSNRLSPFLVDEQSTGLRSDLEGILKTRGIAIVAASCDKGVRVLEGCRVRGEYSFVGLTPQDKLQVMKTQAQAAANLGFGVGGGLEAAFSAGQQFVLQFRMVGKYKTTVPGVVRGQLLSPTCQGATHFVTSVDVGTFASFSATEGSFSASGNYMGQSASASGSTEQSNKVTQGDPEQCPKSESESSEGGKPKDGCNASIRVSLTPIVEADSISVLGEGFQTKDRDCRKGFVLNNNDVCESKETAKLYLCDPSNYEECSQMCEGKDGEFNKKSCGRLANLLMRHIGEHFADKTGESDAESSGILTVFGTVGLDADEFNPFAKENLQRFGPRFKEVCTELGDGATCALATAFAFVSFTTMDPENTTEEEVKQQLVAMYDYIHEGCNAGDTFSCEVLWYAFYEEDEIFEMMVNGNKDKFITRNDEYIKSLKRSCDNANPRSCFVLSKEHVEGHRAFLDIDTAAEYAERGCYGGLSRACIASSAMKLKNGAACQEMLNVKEELEDSGAESTTNEDFATRSNTLDTRFKALICKKSGRDLQTFEVALTDLQDAFEILLNGCELGNPEACQMSTRLYKTLIDKELRRIELQQELREGGAEE